jgi:hypothetical protein
MRSLRFALVPTMSLMAAAMIVSGCVTAGASTNPPAPPQGSATPSAQPSASTPTGFYLRAWQTQALAPQYTFAWPALASISNGQFIDGMIAVPAIYPGPLWIDPSVSAISSKGQDQIVSTARTLGLLGNRSDFTARQLAGGRTAHIEMIVDGKTYQLTGSGDAVPTTSPAPGTPEAFDAFWADVTSIGQWLSSELGPSTPYEPDRLAILAMPPTQPSMGITANEVAWPLAVPFASFGTPLGGEVFRCGVVSGADLATLEPMVKQANQLTRFVDSAKVKDSLVVRVLVPGEPSPCGQ